MEKITQHLKQIEIIANLIHNPKSTLDTITKIPSAIKYHINQIISILETIKTN